MYLPLALRLIEKYISENEVDAEAGGRGGGVAPHYTARSLSLCVCVCSLEIRLYLMVLERMERTEKLLEVVRGPLGKSDVVHSLALTCTYE